MSFCYQLLRSTVPSQSTLGARVLSSILHSRECVVHLYPYSYPISTDSFHSECSLSEAYKKISGAYNTILAGLSPLSINASNDTLRAMVAEVLGLLISATDFPSDLPAALYLATIQMKGTTPTVALMDCLKFFLVGTIEENVVRNLWSSSGALLGFPPSIMIHSNRTNQSYEEMLLYCKDRINAMDSADNELLDEPTILSTLEKQCWSDDFSLRCRWDRINAFASNDIFRKILLSSIVEAIKENLNFDNGASISRLNETKISVGSVAVEILTVIVRNCSTDIMLMLATELRSVSVYYKHFIRRKETNSRDSFYRQQKFQRLLNILFAECCRASNAFCKYFITEFSSEIVADILLVYRELAVAVAINAKEEMTTLSWDFSIGLRLLRTGLIHGLPLELVADVLCAIYLNDKDEKFVAKIIAIEDDVTIIELCFLLEILNRKIAASINFAISDVSNPSEVKLVDDRLLELLNISIKVSNWVISYVSPQHSSNTLSELARNGTKRLVSVGIFNLLSSLMGNSINRDSKSDSSFTKILDLTSVASEGLLSTAAVYCDQYLNQVADNDKLSDLTLLYHAASQIRNLQIKCTSIFHSLAVEELMLSALEDIKKDTTPLIAWQHFELIISLKKLQVSCTIAEGRDIELRCKIVDPLSQILSCYPNTVRNGLFCWYINRLYEYFGYLDVQDFLKRICKTHSYINRPDLVKLLCLVMEKITSKKHANSLDIELLNEILSYILNHDSKLAEVKALSFLTDQLYGSNKLAITIQSFATFQLDYFTILRETSLTNKNHSLMNGFDFMWMYKVTKFVPIQILSAWFALLFDMESSYSFVHSLAVLPRAGQKLFHLVDLCKSEIFLSNLEKECEVDESNYNQVLRNFRLLAIILLEKSDESFGNEFTGELYKSISAKEVSLVNNKVSESRLIAYCEFIADAACNQVVSAEFHSIILWILVSPGMYWRVSYVVWSILSSLRLTQLLKCSSISNYADQCWTVSVLSYKHLHSTTGSKNSMCRVLLKALFSCRGDFTVVENVVAKLITSYIFGDILSGSTFILNSSMGNVLLEVVSSLKFTKQAGNQEAVNSLAIDSLIRTILRSLLGKSNRATSAAPVSGKASLKSILIQLSEDSRKYLQVDCREISLLEILEKLKPIALLDLV